MPLSVANLNYQERSKMAIFILVHSMDGKHLGKALDAESPCPGAFYEGQLPEEGLLHDGHPYPGAFYEGQLPGKAPRSWKSLFRCILRKATTWKGSQEAGNRYPGELMKGTYLERPSRSWTSLCRCSL